jgi:SAM-dependent methyltransferase
MVDPTPAQRREHYEIERELSDRLRNARSREERQPLYGEVYGELAERVPYHPLVLRRDDAAAVAAASAPQVRLLRSFATPGTRFCEIGAGDAGVARGLAPFVSSALAVDVTESMLSGPAKDGNFEFRTFDGLDTGLPAESIDLAYSNDVVEHLHRDDMLEQTRNVARILRPGGKYICVTPNRLSGPHDISRGFSEVADGFHLHEYSAYELARALKRCGFRRVHIVLSLDGRRLSPELPALTVAPIEGVLGLLPRQTRLPLARGLAAIKVVGIR